MNIKDSEISSVTVADLETLLGPLTEQFAVELVKTDEETKFSTLANVFKTEGCPFCLAAEAPAPSDSSAPAAAPSVSLTHKLFGTQHAAHVSCLLRAARSHQEKLNYPGSTGSAGPLLENYYSTADSRFLNGASSGTLSDAFARDFYTFDFTVCHLISGTPAVKVSFPQTIQGRQEPKSNTEFLFASPAATPNRQVTVFQSGVAQPNASLSTTELTSFPLFKGRMSVRIVSTRTGQLFDYAFNYDVNQQLKAGNQGRIVAVDPTNRNLLTITLALSEDSRSVSVLSMRYDFNPQTAALRSNFSTRAQSPAAQFEKGASGSTSPLSGLSSRQINSGDFSMSVTSPQYQPLLPNDLLAAGPAITSGDEDQLLAHLKLSTGNSLSATGNSSANHSAAHSGSQSPSVMGKQQSSGPMQQQQLNAQLHQLEQQRQGSGQSRSNKPFRSQLSASPPPFQPSGQYGNTLTQPFNQGRGGNQDRNQRNRFGSQGQGNSWGGSGTNEWGNESDLAGLEDDGKFDDGDFDDDQEFEREREDRTESGRGNDFRDNRRQNNGQPNFNNSRRNSGSEIGESSPLFLPALPTFPMNAPPGSQMAPIVNLTLDQCRGNVCRLAKSHAGSRFIQQKLEQNDPAYFALFYEEMRDNVPDLMVDNFSHFAIEKLIQCCNDEQCLALLQRLAPAISMVACQKHGSFSVQALVDTLHTPAQIYTLVEAMRPDIMRIITHASGHFVVLRMLQRFPYGSTKFIDDAIVANVSQIATDHHGLRVVKAVLAVRRPAELTRLFKQVARLTMKLVENQYGNYCQEEHELLALASGGSIMARDVTVGTQLAGQDGAIVTVQHCKTLDVNELYRITTSKGSYSVTGNHLITVRWAKNSYITLFKSGSRGGRQIKSQARAGDILTLRAMWYSRDGFTQERCKWTVQLTSPSDIDDEPETDGTESEWCESEDEETESDVEIDSRASSSARTSPRSSTRSSPVSSQPSSRDSSPVSTRKMVRRPGTRATSGSFVYNSRQEALEAAQRYVAENVGEGKMWKSVSPIRLEDKKGRFIVQGQLNQLRPGTTTTKRNGSPKRPSELYKHSIPFTWERPRKPRNVTIDARGTRQELIQFAQRYLDALPAANLLKVGDIFEVPAHALHGIYWKYWNLASHQWQSWATGVATILRAPISQSSTELSTTQLNEEHMQHFARAVQSAKRVASAGQKVLEHFLFRATNAGEYLPVQAGSFAASAYQLHNPLVGDQGTQALNASGQTAYTFLRLESLHKILGIDVEKANLVITELNPIAGDTGAVQSVQSAYDEVCADSMNAVLELNTAMIVAFGSHACQRWRDCVAKGALGIRRGRALNRVRVSDTNYNISKLEFHHSAAGQEERLVSVYLAPHPSNWRDRGLLAATIASAHGIDPKLIPQAVDKYVALARRDEFVSIERLVGPARVVDIQVDGNHRYAFASGILTHNCVQAVLDVAPPGVRTNIKVKMEGKYMRLSKQKFSSNVVERCLKNSSSHWRSIIIRELIAQPAVSELLRDRYGNYVLQTALSVANAQQVQEIVRAITPYLPSLRDNVRSKWKKMLKKSHQNVQSGNTPAFSPPDSPTNTSQPGTPTQHDSPTSSFLSNSVDPPSLQLQNNSSLSGLMAGSLNNLGNLSSLSGLSGLNTNLSGLSGLSNLNSFSNQSSLSNLSGFGTQNSLNSLNNLTGIGGLSGFGGNSLGNLNSLSGIGSLNGLNGYQSPTGQQRDLTQQANQFNSTQNYSHGFSNNALGLNPLGGFNSGAGMGVSGLSNSGLNSNNSAALNGLGSFAPLNTLNSNLSGFNLGLMGLQSNSQSQQQQQTQF